jgi:hypothetical protein
MDDGTAPGLPHVRRAIFAENHRRQQVYRQNTCHGGFILVLYGVDRHDGRIINQDIYLAELFSDLIYKRFDPVVIRNIDGFCDNTTPGLGYQTTGLLDGGRIDVAYRHIGAFTGQMHGNASTNTITGAGNDGDSVG